MKYYPGRPWDLGKRVDIKEMAAVLHSIANSKLNGDNNKNSLDVLTGCLDRTDTIPKTLKAHLPYVKHLIDSAPQVELFHSHGDIGVHNLYITSNNKLMVLDPSGTGAKEENDKRSRRRAKLFFQRKVFELEKLNQSLYLLKESILKRRFGQLRRLLKNTQFPFSRRTKN